MDTSISSTAAAAAAAVCNDVVDIPMVTAEDSDDEPCCPKRRRFNSDIAEPRFRDLLIEMQSVHDRLEPCLFTKYGPAKERWIYLYKEVLDEMVEFKPQLVLVDVQFVGKHLNELVIAYDDNNSIFHRIYPGCQVSLANKETFSFRHSYNRHNYQKTRSGQLPLHIRNADYVSMMCPCVGQNEHHATLLFNDTTFFKRLPSGPNVIYVLRGKNKADFWKNFMVENNLYGHIRTYPHVLSTNAIGYRTCHAHVSAQSHCSVGNIIQMINYYNVCKNQIY